MGVRKNDVLQGTLALLVLRTLAPGKPMHGYAITAHIQRRSDQLLRVEEGSLYPALHRMEQEGWVRAEWGTTDKNREARFYTLTPKGRGQLAAERESWNRLTTGVARVLRGMA
jgi:PadR family transcriptional regulator PadR